MATHKTAYYSGATPLAAGAIIGGGSEEQVEALRAFGLHTGLAFQIQDDLLNLVGTKEAANKDFRTDITEGKRTLVAVHALSAERHHFPRAPRTPRSSRAPWRSSSRPAPSNMLTPTHWP